MKYLIDTDICIALLKGSEHSIAEKMQVHEPNDFALCSIVKSELIYRARKSQAVEKNLLLLNKFFSQFESLTYDDRAAEFYGVNRTILAKAGTPIGESDLLISSIALSNNLTVITRNEREFLRIPGLKLEVW